MIPLASIAGRRKVRKKMFKPMCSVGRRAEFGSVELSVFSRGFALLSSSYIQPPSVLSVF